MDQDIPGCIRMDQDIPQCIRIDRNIAECIRTDQNVSGCIRTDQNVSGCIRMDQDIAGCIRTDPEQIGQPYARCIIRLSRQVTPSVRRDRLARLHRPDNDTRRDSTRRLVTSNSNPSAQGGGHPPGAWTGGMGCAGRGMGWWEVKCSEASQLP